MLWASYCDSLIEGAAMSKLVFEVTQESDGGYCARALTENIFTQGDSWQELRLNVEDAVTAFFFDQIEKPMSLLRLRA